ncbi:MAG: MarR family transcriptional regulator [Burkholderiales bacterium]|nr:MarR family transcriptional regulator [Burkholderiales bacterium]
MQKTTSPLEAHLGYWMRFVSNRVSDEFQSAIETCGVSLSEWVALRTLYDHDSASHGTLIEALGMTKGAVSKLVARLEEKALVAREGDEGDARVVLLRLTDAGRALVPRLADLADANDRKFFGHLSAAQQADLRRLFEEIVRLHALSEVPVR